MEELKVTWSVRGVPLDEIRNVCRRYGLYLDVNEEEVVLLEINDACDHKIVFKMPDNSHVCIECLETRSTTFGKEVATWHTSSQ